MGHVEVILSFVMFMGFLLFGLYFFNPLSNTRVLDSSLFYANDEITSNVSTSLLVYGVSINQTSYSAPQNVQLSLPSGSPPARGFFAHSIRGERLNGTYSGGILSLNRDGSEFFYVGLGDFNSVMTLVVNPAPLEVGTNYTISSSEEREVVSEERIRALNESYYSTYDSVRTEFNLPRRVDFALEVTLSPQEIISLTRPIPEGFDVVSRVDRVEIIRADGGLSFADMRVQVW